MTTPSLRLTVQYTTRERSESTVIFDVEAILIRLQPPAGEVISYTYPVNIALRLEREAENHRLFMVNEQPTTWRHRDHPLFYLFPAHEIGLMYFPSIFQGQVPTDVLIGFSTSHIAK